MSDIIKRMTYDCQREDCKLVSSTFGTSNSGGSSAFWECLTCRMKWSVRFPRSHEQTTWDRNGVPTQPIPPEPEIRKFQDRAGRGELVK